MDSTVRATERREGKTSPVVTVKHVRQPAGRFGLSLVRLAADVRFPKQSGKVLFQAIAVYFVWWQHSKVHRQTRSQVHPKHLRCSADSQLLLRWLVH